MERVGSVTLSHRGVCEVWGLGQTRDFRVGIFGREDFRGCRVRVRGVGTTCRMRFSLEKVGVGQRGGTERLRVWAKSGNFGCWTVNE